MTHVMHVVMFKFEPGASEKAVTRVCEDFAALQSRCVYGHVPYIVSIEAGKDCSIEGKANGFSHVYIVRFRSAKDRDYYCNDDPEHIRFKASLAGLVADAQVIDFVNGTW
ncbi:hypothetical protein PYCC9005_005267 [Savitreella phatthalungensis]